MTRTPLSQLDDWQLENSNQDLRGKTVMAEDGRTIGTVTEMIVNTDTEYVDELILDDGTPIPTSDIRTANGDVYYMAAPAAPSADMTTQRSANMTGTTNGDTTIPIIAEEIRVGKRQVEGGGVRVNTRVEEVPVQEQVTLRDEEIDVQRRKVDRPVSEADVNTFQEGSFEIRERDEQAVVDKQARVVEEVVIDKDVTERTEQIQDTVRRTDVDVEQVRDREKGR